jgi:DHA1 family bicyclomycin/chloramphenicol resistance-like MFS transporter
MEKLITTSFILVVSATYIALFYNTPNQMFVFVVVLQCNFQYRFSFGNLRAMAMEPVGHIAGLPQRLLALFLLSWLPISIFIGRFIADGALPLFFDMCSIISRITYLFKIDEKRVNITSKTEFDCVSRL